MARLLILSSAQSVIAKAPTLTFLAYILTLLCIWAIYKCSVSDPGYVPQSLSKMTVRNYCNNCKAPKPERAHHCRRCNRCVHRMDHHCVWINNCVGYKNQKFFILFLTYLVILGGYDCVLICYHSFTSFSIHGLPSLAMTLVMFIFFALNLGTAIYAGIYLREQLESVETNTTLIETYQGTRGDPEANVFVQLFGERKFLWFCRSIPPFHQITMRKYLEWKSYGH